MEYWRTSKRVAKEFSPFVDEHYLGSDGELHLYPVQKNTQEEIDSYLETSLQAILDKLSTVEAFNAPVNPANDYIEEYIGNKDKLDLLLEADNVIDEINREYGLTGTRAATIKFIRDKVNTTFEDYKKNKQLEKEEQISAKTEKVDKGQEQETF